MFLLVLSFRGIIFKLHAGKTAGNSLVYFIYIWSFCQLKEPVDCAKVNSNLYVLNEYVSHLSPDSTISVSEQFKV